MKKILLYGALGMLVLALGTYITLQFFLGSIVKAGVNRFGPTVTQTKVELAEANISPLSGIGSLRGLTVANPKGWSDQNAFRLGRVHVEMQPFSVFGDHIVINEITIEEPEFLYETKIVASNIGDLMKNVESALASGSSEPKTKSGKPIKMEIKKLVLRNGQVKLGLGVTAVSLPMPPINMTNLGTDEGGITPTQVAFAVMRNVTNSVVAASTQAMTKINATSGAAAIDAAKDAADAIKGIFGGGKKK